LRFCFGQGTPSWDHFPRIVESANLSAAVDLQATIGMNAAQNDPGWGLFGQWVGTRPERAEAFRRAGLKSISYYETFGQSYCHVGELPDHAGCSSTSTIWRSTPRRIARKKPDRSNSASGCPNGCVRVI
jgi:hypothetical protein